MKKSYKDVFGYFDFEDIYDEAVEKAEDGDILIEIGCYRGKSTLYLAEKIRESGKELKFYAIDIWDKFIGSDPDQEGDIYKIFKENIEGYEDIIIPLRMDSTLAAKKFKKESVQFCFIDSDHSYEKNLADLKAWYPKIRIGGTLAGHDYIYAPGVERAVKEFFTGKEFGIYKSSFKHYKI